MKHYKLISSLLFLTATVSTQAQASGVECHAQCVVVDGTNDRVHILDTQIITQADARRLDVFEHLKTKCSILAQDYGLTAPAVLVAELDFVEQGRSSSHARISAYGYRWSRWYGYGYSYGATTTTQHSSSYMRVSYTAATPRESCHIDESIPEGTPLEYLGDLPVYD